MSFFCFLFNLVNAEKAFRNLDFTEETTKNGQKCENNYIRKDIKKGIRSLFIWSGATKHLQNAVTFIKLVERTALCLKS